MKTKTILTVIVGCTLWLTAPIKAKDHEEPGTIITIECPDAENTAVREINARGDIVGTCDGAFLLTKHDEFVMLDLPDASAFASNAAGDMVGWFGGPDPRQSFLMEGSGDLITIDFPVDPTLYSWQAPQDINAAGDVVGFWGEYGPHLSPPYWTEHGYLRTRHGEYITVDFPGAVLTNVRGINESGDMVGLYAPDSPGGPYFGFLYSHGEFVSLEDYFSNANGINPQGQIVGNFSDEDGRHVGILDLNRETFISFDVPGTLIEAWKINPSGYVSGFYRGEDGLSHGFIRTPDH
ncbi:MAG: hypothetical protein ACWGQW_12905 [bacterium]